MVALLVDQKMKHPDEGMENIEGLAQNTLELDAAYAVAAFQALPQQLNCAETPDSPVWASVVRLRLLVGLTDGRWVSCPLDWFPRLARSDTASLSTPELSPLGIHWASADEDISTDGLLAGIGDITNQFGQRERFLNAPTPRIENSVCGADALSLQLSDGRCLGIPLSVMTQPRRASRRVWALSKFAKD